MSDSPTTRMLAIRGHLRRAAAFALLALALTGVAPLVGQQPVSAAPTAARIVFPGWNVGASPRICEVDSTISGSVCSTIPITDATVDATSGVAAGDLNADGRTDVVISNESGGVNMCLDNGAGGWSCTAHGPTGRHSSVSIADLDGNGSPDVVTVNETQATMRVCTNSGTGTFTCTNQSNPNWTTGLAVLDVDGDTDNDLVIGGDGSGVYQCINNGSAVFSCSTFAGVTSARDIEAGMLDADPYPDLVFASNSLDDMVCFGGPSATFTCSSLSAGASFGASIGDLDGDTDLDVVLARSGVASRSCLNGGSQAFTCGDLTAPIANWRDTDIADVTGDGLADIVAAVQGPNVVCPGDGSGGVTGCTVIDGASSWHSLHVVVVEEAALPDTDGDGVGDGGDNCVNIVNADQLDTDGDTAGDACDADDDGDGLTDSEETGTHGTDPLLADTDGDGWSDFDEVNNGGNPLQHPQPQSVSIAAPDPWPGANGTFEVLADTTSMQPLDIAASGACTVSGTTVQPVSAGACTLTASQSGGYLFLPASNAVTIDLVTSAQSLMISAPTSMTVDDTIAVSAVADSGLPVNLSTSGPCTLSAGDLTVSGAGTCTLTADQPGDIWHEPASATHPIDVVREPQAITIAAAASMVAMQSAPLTVTTGSGQPLSSLTVAGPCTLEPGAVLTDESGTCTITATHDGDGHWEPAVATHTITVTPATQTIVVVAPGTIPALDTVTLAATADSTLPVSLSASGPCSISGNELQATAAGTCTVTAEQAGDARWAAASSTTAIEVTPRPQTIALAGPATMTVGDAASMTASSTSGLAVTLAAAGGCTLTGLTVTAEAVGDCVVTATQPGSTTWAAAPLATTTIAVAPRPTTTTTTTTTPITTTVPVGVPDTSVTTVPASPATATTAPRTSPRATATSSTTTTAATTSTSPPSTSTTSTTSTTLRPTTSTSSTTSSTTTTVPDVEAVRVTVTVDELVDDGLPDATDVPVRLVLTGLRKGTTATLSVGDRSFEASLVGDDLVFDLPAALDLHDATLEIVDPEGIVTRVTTADVFEDGDLTMQVEFASDEGTETGASTLRVFGDGFVAGSSVVVSMHSDPIELATVTAGADGGFDEQLTLPPAVEPGEHRVLLAGQSADGPITGAWNFAVGTDGALERVGDPPVDAAVAGAGLEAGAIEEAAASGAPALESPAAAAEAAETIGTAQAAEGAAAPVATVVDPATGLVEYTPVAEPERAVETAVESFALISIVGAGGSLLAAGVAALPTGGAPVGGSAPSGGGNGGGSGGSSGGDGDDKKRGKGKLAGGKASKLGQRVEGSSWGDRSPTWRWPLTSRVDQAGVALPARLHPVSPLTARVLADGSTLRAALGSFSLLAPVLGALLGLLAAMQTGGHAVAPSLGLMLAIVVLGALDASSGLAAALAFGVAVSASGGLTSADAVRSLLGISSIWFAAPLLAGGARAFRRAPSADAAQRWQATGDVVMGSLLAAWAIQSVVGSLPALSGLDMPVAARADLVAGVVLVALVVRYLVERAAVRLYPERLDAVTFDPPGKPSMRQQVASTCFKAGMFVFVIFPYIGPRWQLWAVTAMTIGPSLLGLVKDRFPNVVLLHRVLPRGVPNTLVMMTVGTVLGAAITARIEDPSDLLAWSFLLLSIPGFVLSLLGLFGREGANPSEGWTSRSIGTVVALVAILKIRGHLGDSPWLPILLMAPAAVWWFVATRRRTEPAVEPEAVLDPVLDTADGAVEDERWPAWPGDATSQAPAPKPAPRSLGV